MNKMDPVSRSVDETLAIPLYHQVYLILREHIRSGVYAATAALPSEAALCEDFNVSRITVKRAMRELATDGLIVRHRGKGTFVAESGTTSTQPDALEDLVQNVQAIGESTDVLHLASDLIEANPDIAAKLVVGSGQKVLKSNHLRLSDGEPLAVIVTYVPEDVADKLDPETVQQPMLVRLSDAGIALDRADQDVTATLAEPTIAVQLGIEVGSPLLRLTRLVFDDTERPVEWLTALYRADRYAVRTALTHETIGQVSGWYPA